MQVLSVVRVEYDGNSSVLYRRVSFLLFLSPKNASYYLALFTCSVIPSHYMLVFSQCEMLPQAFVLPSLALPPSPNCICETRGLCLA